MDPLIRNRIGMGLASAVLLVSMGGGPDRVSALPVRAEHGCPGSNAAPRSDTLSGARGAVLCLVNAERAARNRRPLVLNPRLQTAAECHSRDMAARDFFGHVTPEGTGYAARVRAAGLPSAGVRLAENLAWGSGALARPASVVVGWMSSPPHRATILNPALRRVGIGIALDAPEADVRNGATYTADFAGTSRPRTPRAHRSTRSR